MRWTTLSCLVGLLVSASLAVAAPPAEAVPIRVSWSATADVGFPVIMSGTLGVFDVTAAGQEFEIHPPLDFHSGGRDLTLDQEYGTGVRFRFDSTSPPAGQLTGDGGIFYFLDDQAGSTISARIISGNVAFHGLTGDIAIGCPEGCQFSAPMVYAFETLPEPALPILGAPVVAFAAARLRERRHRSASRSGEIVS